jgi:NADPH:quinone reductase-like Zn-dependent oxidoreductase
MKAVIQNKYGGPEQLQLIDVPKPRYKSKEVLIQIKATNVSSGDMRVNTLSVSPILKPIMAVIFGFRGPRNQIRGISASGVIVEKGEHVTQYRIGDEVYFINSMKAGCLAQYIALPENTVMVKKPSILSFEEAAPIAFGALSAYHFINAKTISEGQQVLIYGASGSVGSYALQLAKYYGAIVTAVSSASHHNALLELGADHVIDYTTTNFRTLEKTYDIIFDAVMKCPKKECKHLLHEEGKYLSVMSPTKESVSRLMELNKIIESKSLQTLIDAVYPLNQFKEAHAHTYGGHKEGNVVIQIN